MLKYLDVFSNFNNNKKSILVNFQSLHQTSSWSLKLSRGPVDSKAFSCWSSLREESCIKKTQSTAVWIWNGLFGSLCVATNEIASATESMRLLYFTVFIIIFHVSSSYIGKPFSKVLYLRFSNFGAEVKLCQSLNVQIHCYHIYGVQTAYVSYITLFLLLIKLSQVCNLKHQQRLVEKIKNYRPFQTKTFKRLMDSC